MLAALYRQEEELVATAEALPRSMTNPSAEMGV
jgi:hypothetical protein